MKTPIIRMRGRSLLTLQSLTTRELNYLLDLTQTLKAKRAAGVHGRLLERKNIALVFEKMSTRTRCAAVVAAADEGGRAEYLSCSEIHLGKKESPADTARVLGRMFDGILFRGFEQRTARLLAKHSGVPVWNGLTDESHPTQALADLFTIRETFGRLAGLKVVYIGDGRNNVAMSLMEGCAMTGIHFVNCTPPSLSPRAADLAWARKMARATGGSVRVVHQPTQAVKGANVLYTDVWTSMGEEAKQAERLAVLRPYQVNMALVRRTGNVKSGRLIFLHCLPALHDRNTEATRESGPQEVTDEVFEAGFSKVFDQAENRLHTIKAMFVASLCRPDALKREACQPGVVGED